MKSALQFHSNQFKLIEDDTYATAADFQRLFLASFRKRRPIASTEVVIPLDMEFRESGTAFQNVSQLDFATNSGRN